MKKTSVQCFTRLNTMVRIFRRVIHRSPEIFRRLMLYDVLRYSQGKTSMQYKNFLKRILTASDLFRNLYNQIMLIRSIATIKKYRCFFSKLIH